MSKPLSDTEKEAMAQRVVETYNECCTLLDFLATLTPEQIEQNRGLRAFVAMPIKYLVETFVNYTDMVNQLQNAGITPTPKQSTMVINLAMATSNAFASIERSIDTEDPEDTEEITSIGPAGNLH